MRQDIKITGDGSFTLYVPELNEHYHSVYGAVQESKHVFIKSGLRLLNIEKPKILEIGFGTGLNALLTLLNSEKFEIIEYDGVEFYPLDWEKVLPLEYHNFLKLSPDQLKMFEKIHTSPWNELVQINQGFILYKLKMKIQDFISAKKYDLVYFDAFAPEVQPELWTEKNFQRIYTVLNINGILVTYCAKGEVRRIMQRCGFTVERLAGPPGKREMLRAFKNEL